MKEKVKYEYVVMGYYAMGWEEVYATDSQSEAYDNLRLYRENEKTIAFKVIRRKEQS